MCHLQYDLMLDAGNERDEVYLVPAENDLEPVNDAMRFRKRLDWQLLADNVHALHHRSILNTGRIEARSYIFLHYPVR